MPGKREEPRLILRCRDVAYDGFARIPFLVMIMLVSRPALCASVRLFPRVVVPAVGALLRRLVVLGISAGPLLCSQMVVCVTSVCIVPPVPRIPRMIATLLVMGPAVGALVSFLPRVAILPVGALATWLGLIAPMFHDVFMIFFGDTGAVSRCPCSLESFGKFDAELEEVAAPAVPLCLRPALLSAV